MIYLLFAGDNYYPKGGAEDLIGKFDSIEKAISAHDANKYDWANILCVETGKIFIYFGEGDWRKKETHDW